MMRPFPMVSLVLGLFLLLMQPFAFSEPAKKAAPVSVKGQTKTNVKASLNPLVPYTLASAPKPVLIPQSLATLLASPVPSVIQDTDFLRTVSLDLSRYPNGLSLAGSFNKADEVMAVLEGNTDLPVHLEALRQGYVELPATEKKDLVVKLFKRYESAPEDAVNYFDYGYAQLVYLNNQTGLFFLRKANDKLKNQFTALAYAMGQAQVDLNQEKSSANEMTIRKMDVIHKLSDALAQDIQDHQPGFWPAYIQSIEKLSRFPAYQDFTKDDFSASYVPYGKRISYSQLIADIPAIQSAKPAGESYALVGLAANKSSKRNRRVKILPSSLEAEQTIVLEEEPVIGVVVIPNSVNRLKFANLETPAQVKVTVLDTQNQPLMSFISQGGLDIVEDLEKDGVYELVIRQYRQSPFDPIRVYRLTENGYELDKDLYSKFQ